MVSRTAKVTQLTMPLDVDKQWPALAEREEARTPVAARNEVQAAELLSIVTGMRFEQAEEALRRAGGLHKLAQLPDYALQELPHIGPRRARQIRAMTEWSLVLTSMDEWQSVPLRTPSDLANKVMLEMGLLEREELRVAALDTRNRLMDMETVYQGSMNAAVVRVGEVVRMPVARQSASMIMVHNHPSGDPSPSPEDLRITKLVQEAARTMDIELLDHLIIGRNCFVSLRERGLGFG